MKCPNCCKGRSHRWVHDHTRRSVNVHEPGTERYECLSCGYKMFVDEGSSQGLRYVYDIVKPRKAKVTGSQRNKERKSIRG